MNDYEVLLEEVEPERVAARRERVPNYGAVGQLTQALYREMLNHDIEPRGPAMALYYDEQYQETDVDVEAAFPIAETVEARPDSLTLKTLGGGTFATVVHHGPYDDFTPAYQALMEWVQSNGYRIIGPNREIYLRGPESDVPPQEYLTRIQFPVAPAAG